MSKNYHILPLILVLLIILALIAMLFPDSYSMLASNIFSMEKNMENNVSTESENSNNISIIDSSWLTALRSSAAFWYYCNEGAGWSLKDQSNNNINATIISNAPSWRNSTIGNGIGGDGSLDYFVIPQRPAAIKADSWLVIFKSPMHTGVYRTLLDAGYYDAQFGVLIYFDKSKDIIRILYKNTTGGSDNVFFDLPYSPNITQSIGSIWNGSKVQWFINGNLYNSTQSLRGSLNVPQDIFGFCTRNNTLYSNSSIYFLARWNHAISQSDLKSLNNFILNGGKKKGSFSIVSNPDPALRCRIPTYDGSGQAVHPSVLYIPGGFAGYTYWMAMTPYPWGQSGYENPSIVASNDGITWIVPTGITNPIEPKPKTGHNYDPELVYDGSQLICYYFSQAFGPCYRTIQPNMFVGPRHLFKEVGIGGSAVGLVRRAANDWIMWVSTGNTIRRFLSSDGVTFYDDGQVNLSNYAKWVPWHTSVFKDGDTYRFLVAMYPVGSNNGITSLWYGSIGNPRDNISNIRLVVSPGLGWTNGQIYRSCMIKIADTYKVYISARDKNLKWNIGYIDNFNV